MMDGQNTRSVHRLAQLQDRSLAQIVRQKHDDVDPPRARGERLGEPALQLRLKPLESVQFRLAPEDDLFERKVLLSDGCRRLPAIPDSGAPRRFTRDICSKCGPRLATSPPRQGSIGKQPMDGP